MPTSSQRSMAGSASSTNAIAHKSHQRQAPTFDTLALSLNYIVDFWGQYRRATESARATLLATRYGQEVVRVYVDRFGRNRLLSRSASSTTSFNSRGSP